MTNSSGRAKQWYLAALLVALVAGCAADQTGVSGITAATDNPALQRVATKLNGSAPVNLGDAGNFVILAKSGISTVPQSVVTGNIGVSPIARGGMTGFSETIERI